jgi:2-polyprenyl-3-methyl-5-hydroxy-6-metoxy-1,4-benzoquinol methylase
MKDIDYSKWADYIEKLFCMYKINPTLILDLGCGTGSFCIEMSKRGYEMIGVDLSSEMLSCAKTKSIEQDVQVLYLNQDMTEFELYGTVDAVVCLMDSMNYVTYKNDIKHIFKLVNNYLNPGGLFIFDINSYFKIEKILSNNVFFNLDDDITYIWQNSFDKNKRICRFDLTFFVKNLDSYKRFDETHYERAYTMDEISDIVNRAGLHRCAVYGEFDFGFPGKRCERIFFVCKK